MLCPLQCIEAAQKLSSDDVASLPAPGEVDMICGGPPCQGYSGMNRFNKVRLHSATGGPCHSCYDDWA